MHVGDDFIEDSIGSGTSCFLLLQPTTILILLPCTYRKMLQATIHTDLITKYKKGLIKALQIRDGRLAIRSDVILVTLSCVVCLQCTFKMSKTIGDPADCEIRSAIRFLTAKNVKPAEIPRQIKDVYGENAMSDGMARKWLRLINEGRTNVHDEPRSARPSVVNDDDLGRK